MVRTWLEGLARTFHRGETQEGYEMGTKSDHMKAVRLWLALGLIFAVSALAMAFFKDWLYFALFLALTVIMVGFAYFEYMHRARSQTGNLTSRK